MPVPPTLSAAAEPGTPEAVLAARTLYRRLYTIYTEISVVMAVVGCALFFLSLEMGRRQVLIGLGLVTAAYVPMISIDVVIMAVQYRVIHRFLRGERQLAPAAMIRALNLPVLTFGRVLLVHFPTFATSATVGILLANRYLDFGFRNWQFGALLLLLVFIACIHAVYEYFEIARAVRPIIPMIRRHAQLVGLPPELSPTRVSMRQKLLVASTLAGVIPLVVLGGTTVFKAGYLYEMLGSNAIHDLGRLWMWVMWLAFFSGAVVLIIGHVLAKDVSAPARELVTAMHKVGKGDVSQQMDVTTTDEFAELFEGFNQMTRGLEERAQLRDAFGRYLGPAAAEEVLKHGVHLGGELVEATILFADIRGFTTLSERMPPAQVVALLNGYFAAVEPAIQAEGGWINKFGGDSLLAVFGAPNKMADHPARALKAALRIRAALADFNAQQRRAAMPELAIGIGIHTGDVLAGNVGSPTRLEYTVIGDVVNVAARLQALTKDHHTDIIASSLVLQRAGFDAPTRELPVTSVRGKTEAVRIFALDPQARALSA